MNSCYPVVQFIDFTKYCAFFMMGMVLAGSALNRPDLFTLARLPAQESSDHDAL
jgi:hypothetical protein